MPTGLKQSVGWRMLLLLWLTGWNTCLLAGEERSAPVDYSTQVKPLLVRCVACHGGLRQKNGLRLDAPQFLRTGGTGGPAIEPGRSDNSLLIDAIRGTNNVPRMPPEGEGEPLTAAQIELLAQWIDQGAVAPAEEPQGDPRQHWSFQPVRRVSAPSSRFTPWAENPVDLFLAADWERLGLEPVPEADRTTLLRRVTFDLTGLPPTPSELSEFLADTSPAAWHRVVDRLLDSPRYAERWGRHFMDIWRYSDWYGSRGGNELRNSRRHIWRWRDWILDSLDQDKPYDQMLLEMLAPDEVAPGNLAVQRAGGFLGRNYYVFNRHVWLQDTVEYTGQALLGLTFKCCRCHDHKYDPISQEEYYRFRAFFEPYGVRTDPQAGRMDKLTGNQPAKAPPGATLAHGDDVVYDSEPATPTHLLIRGNEKDPVTERPLAPGVPEVLGLPTPDITPVQLPLGAFYPELRPEFRDSLLSVARGRVASAESAITRERAEHDRLAAQVATLAEGATLPPLTAPGPPFLNDDFRQPLTEFWEPLSGDWQYRDGQLVQTQVGSFLTMQSRREHPTDFRARIRYKTLPAGDVHSVGLGFDVTPGAANWQAVYTATNNTRSTVQAFHRVAGVESYPTPGIAEHPFKLEQTITVDLAVRGTLLNVWVDGQLRLAYRLPVARRAGRFALWQHSASAEISELLIEPLPEGQVLVESLVAIDSPFARLTRESLAIRVEGLAARLRAAEVERDLATAEEGSLRARQIAEVARYAGLPTPEWEVLAQTASRAERQATALLRRKELAEAEGALAKAREVARDGGADAAMALQKAEQRVTEAKGVAESSLAAVEATSTTYTPVGTAYPAESTGRRLALARWLTRPDHPLVPRALVNHVWHRHFGAPLAGSPFNLGLNGKRPTHPQLLDWLAAELISGGYRLKPLHRLLLTSRAYRLQSAETAAAPQNLAVDRENRWFWRAHARRLEAESVRDGLLHLAGDLDPSRGGPDLEPSQADTLRRRSLFFRHTPDDRAQLLETFDAATAAECAVREESIVPQQALALANGEFATRQSRRIAARLSDGTPDAGAFIERAYREILGRTPRADEREVCQAFLASPAAAGVAEQPPGNGPPGNPATAVPPLTSDQQRRARENLIHVLINSHDFVTVR
jgi:hypothetical protein